MLRAPGAKSGQLVPDELEEVTLNAGAYPVLDLLKLCGLVESNSDSRRLIRQGAVSLRTNDHQAEKIKDEKERIELEPNTSYILKVGTRRFKKVLIR